MAKASSKSTRAIGAALTWGLLATCGSQTRPRPGGTNVAVSIRPEQASLLTSSQLQFTAQVSGAPDPSADWSVQEGAAGGVVTASGLYTAPGSAGVYHVVATSRAESTSKGSATVSVVAVLVTISPSFAMVAPGASKQFVATVAGAADTAVSWSIQEGPGSGTISQSGLYVAPGLGDKTVHVEARSLASPSARAVATVAVSGAGCGVNSPAGDQPAQTLSVNGAARSYFLSVPAAYDPSVPLPLVFAYHGAGGNGADLRYLLRLEGGDPPGPGTGRAIFVYPDGIGGGWDLGEAGADVQMFDALVQLLGSRYCIDKRRIFAVGFSFGHTMSNMLGCYRGQVVRAVAGDGGGIIPAEPDCHGAHAPAWIAYGQNDPYLADYGLHTRDFWMARNHCGPASTPVSPEPCVTFSGCDPGYPVTWCFWLPGNHDWPAFAPAGAWNFFASFK